MEIDEASPRLNARRAHLGSGRLDFERYRIGIIVCDVQGTFHVMCQRTLGDGEHEKGRGARRPKERRKDARLNPSDLLG
jgi:hypothetical protein